MMSKEKNKQKYVAPAMEVIEVENEGGIMAVSGGVSAPGMNDGGGMFSTGGTRSTKSNAYQGGNALGELEDILNDLLTVEK